MASTKLTWFMALVAGILVPLSVGCIPVTPFKHKSYEDEFYVHERYARVPILGPITAGGPVKASILLPMTRSGGPWSELVRCKVASLVFMKFSGTMSAL